MPAMPPTPASSTASTTNCVRTWRRVAPERAAQPDLAAPLEHRDHHDVGDADAADEQRHAAEPEQQRGERLVGLRLRRERVGGSAHLHLVWRLRVGRRRQHVAHGVDLLVGRSRTQIVDADPIDAEQLDGDRRSR